MKDAVWVTDSLSLHLMNVVPSAAHCCDGCRHCKTRRRTRQETEALTVCSVHFFLFSELFMGSPFQDCAQPSPLSFFWLLLGTCINTVRCLRKKGRAHTANKAVQITRYTRAVTFCDNRNAAVQRTMTMIES